MQALILAPTGATPVESGLIHAEEQSCGHATPFAVASAQHEKHSRRLHVLDQSADSFDTECGDKVLLGEDIFKLLSVFIGKFMVVCLLDRKPVFFCSADIAATIGVHLFKNKVLALG